MPTATFAGQVHAFAEQDGLADYAPAWLLDGAITTPAEARSAII